MEELRRGAGGGGVYDALLKKVEADVQKQEDTVATVKVLL